MDLPAHTKIHSSWALTTTEGFILIDTLYEYASDEAIVTGLRKLGLDPVTVKYVIITHAHGDHVGGAKLMQDRFGSRIVMGGPDWDSIEKSVNQMKVPASFAGQFYVLREHVGTVRERLGNMH